MIAKYYHQTLYTFEKRTGMTALFSGNELSLVSQYARDGKQTAFIDRLFDLGIFVGHIQSVLADCFGNPETDSPQSLHIDVTNRCPLNCAACYKIPGEIVEMQYHQWQQLIREAEQLKVFQIAIGGGEPMVHPNIVRFVQQVAQTEMSVTITSSGFGLSAELLDELIESGLNHLQISLNGSTEAVNKRSRDGYLYAINALELLSHTTLSYGVNWVARKSNVDDFEALVDLAKQYKAENINVLRYKPSPKEDYTKESLDRNEFLALAGKMKQVRGLKVKTDSAYSNLLIHINNRKVSRNTCGCGAGKTFMAISPDGCFKPCSHLSLSDTCKTITDYWMDSPGVMALRELMFEKEPGSCGSCIFEDICGGCRAICERLYGDITQGEHNCPTYKSIL
jgi:pyrroloquinoline quinone biosynthesis protein E